MAIPIISEALDIVRSLFDFFVNNIPKPLQILFIVMIGGVIMGQVVPFVYSEMGNFECVGDKPYFKDGRCDATLSIYDYYSNEAVNMSIVDKVFTWVYVTTHDVNFVDAKGNILDPDEMRQYTRDYWVDLACVPYEAGTYDLNTSFPPLCEDGSIRPTLWGNDIFNTVNFMVLLISIYLVGLVVYLFKR